MAARRYCFTVNNPTLSHQETIDELKALSNFRYVVFQKERAPTTGTPHYQGYIMFTNNTRITTIQRHTTDNFSLTRCNGNHQSNVAYCTKEDTRLDGPWTAGEEPHAGARTDITDFAAYVRDEARSLRAVVERDPAMFLRYSRGVESILRSRPIVARTPPVVVLLYGPPGTGKTRLIYDSFPVESIYRKICTDSFFDGYVGQDVLLLDDFAGKASKMALTDLLGILDRYPYRLPIKGSSTDLVSSKIYITTNVHPKLWYDYTNRAGEWRCVSRRINQVVWFKNETTSYHLTKHSFFDDWTEFCDEEHVFIRYANESPSENQEDANLDDPL